MYDFPKIFACFVWFLYMIMFFMISLITSLEHAVVLQLPMAGRIIVENYGTTYQMSHRSDDMIGLIWQYFTLVLMKIKSKNVLLNWDRPMWNTCMSLNNLNFKFKINNNFLSKNVLQPSFTEWFWDNCSDAPCIFSWEMSWGL